MEHLDKLSPGEKIAGGSAILLFIFMFFDWFGVEVTGVGGFSGSVPGEGGSAWDALDFIPIILLITIVAALVHGRPAPCRLGLRAAGADEHDRHRSRRDLGPADPLPDRRSAQLRRLRRRLGRRDAQPRHLPRADRGRRHRLWRLQHDERRRDHLRRCGRPALQWGFGRFTTAASALCVDASSAPTVFVDPASAAELSGSATSASAEQLNRRRERRVTPVKTRGRSRA